MVQVCFSSCYLGVKKPEWPTYRMAVRLSQWQPTDLHFIGHREPQVEGAADPGMGTVLFTTVSRLRGELSRRDP